MIPWTLVAVSSVPGGAEELRLLRRGSEFVIMLGASALMNSRLSGSEEALAVRACRQVRGREPLRVLVGGLGMGFTLRAALAELGPDAQVTVAELVPAVVAWARGPLAAIFGDCLADPRVGIVEGDVAGLIRAAAGAYDAILLDVDNGPDGMTRDGNDGLYGAKGLRRAWTALRPGGVLAVWSVAPDDAFAERMRRTGFTIEDVRVRANKGRRGARHVIWIGQRGA